MAIIDIDNFKNSNITCVQISIYKAIIFNVETLRNLLIKMMNYISVLYDFKMERKNIFFTYIFDYSQMSINPKIIFDMIKDCQKKTIKYMFF